MPFDDSQPRDDKGMWTSGDAGDAIQVAASDQNKYLKVADDIISNVIKNKRKVIAHTEKGGSLRITDFKDTSVRIEYSDGRISGANINSLQSILQREGVNRIEIK